MTHSALPRSVRHLLILLACALALAIIPPLPAQVRFSWVRAGNSGNHNLGYNVAVGSDGSVAAAGLMDYYINLGSTNFYAYANSGNRDALLTQYSGAGELLWARADGGGSSEEARGSAIDAAGNTYTCGFFGGTTYFGSTNLVSRGSDDMFLAKYSPSGEVLWVVQAGGPSPDYGWRVAVDSQGQPVVVGTFYGTMDFGGTNLTAIGNQQVFVAKYSSGGALLWAARLAGNGDVFSHGITVGSGGETYVSGYFNNNLQYDERCTFALGGLDGFLARLSNTGTMDWVRASGGNEVEYGQGVAVSPDGTVWTCGYFYGSLPAVGTNLISVGNYNIYLSRYSSNGTLLHGQSFGGNANDYATGLAIDGETNVYVAGHFESSPLSFPGTNLYTAGSADLFLLRLDAAGNFRWATRVGGGNAEYAYGLAVSQNRDLYLTGFYSYGTTFGDTNFSTSSSYGFYLAKYTRDLPVFLTQPASQVLSEGSTLSLSVTVTSSTPLSLQWQWNGTNLPGATNATLVIPGASPLHSGAYTLRAGNTEGVVPSDPASVLVTSFSTTLGTTGLVWSTGGDAVWYSQTNIAFDGPESARSGSITNNQQTWLQTRVVGPARVSYYWKVSSENGYDFLRFSLNGAELTNTSGKVEWKLVSFLLPAGTNLLRWTYTKDESESVGSDGGWLDAVSVVYAPAIPVPPPSLVVTSGIQVTLQAPVTGTAPFLYQWQWFGTNLPGATAATLTLSNVQPYQAGPYVLVASNAAGVTASAPGLLTVLTPPALTLQPIDQTVSPGVDVLFTAGASGSGTLAYQWLFQGQPLPGATNASLLLTNVQSTQVGAYQIQVSSPTGTTLSPVARLTLTGLVLRPTLFIEGRMGDTYRIEYREGVKATNWLNLTNLTLTVSPQQFVDYSAEGRPQRYYRVIAQ